MSNARTIARTALVAGFAVLAPGAAPLFSQSEGEATERRERCYGVSLEGENDGIGDESAPGTATRDFQGDAWVWVTPGECPILPLPAQADGTPRRGAPVPLERDRS
jgi:uncharacterized membrane protein